MFKKRGKGRIFSPYRIRKGRDKESGEPALVLEEVGSEEGSQKEKNDIKREDSGTPERDSE